VKLSLRFGLAEPGRTVIWWQGIHNFPKLVLYKDKKYEFSIYEEDPSKHTDYIFHFSQVQSYNPVWHVTHYDNIDYLFNDHLGCECGASHTDFPQVHMFYCQKWSKI
jgi:hypothetical protein